MSPLGLFLLTGGLVLFILAWVAYQRRRVMADTPARGRSKVSHSAPSALARRTSEATSSIEP